jgi:hypothetical protein
MAGARLFGDCLSMLCISEVTSGDKKEGGLVV